MSIFQTYGSRVGITHFLLFELGIMLRPEAKGHSGGEFRDTCCFSWGHTKTTTHNHGRLPPTDCYCEKMANSGWKWHIVLSDDCPFLPIYPSVLENILSFVIVDGPQIQFGWRTKPCVRLGVESFWNVLVCLVDILLHPALCGGSGERVIGSNPSGRHMAPILPKPCSPVPTGFTKNVKKDMAPISLWWWVLIWAWCKKGVAPALFRFNPIDLLCDSFLNNGESMSILVMSVHFVVSSQSVRVFLLLVIKHPSVHLSARLPVRLPTSVRPSFLSARQVDRLGLISLFKHVRIVCIVLLGRLPLAPPDGQGHSLSASRL